MKITLLTPKQTLNKAYLKEKVIRSQFDLFKNNLKTLLEETRTDESEEHSKKPLIKFLENTYYKEKNEINTKDRIDLVIYNDKTSDSSSGVLIEVKKESNISEMVTKNDINKKAFHELMLYYLRERVDGKNIDIKYLVATNIYEWFIFDATDFERLFYKNTDLLKKYEEWKNHQKVSGNTDLFYNEIANPFLKECTNDIKFTYFDIRQFNTESDKPEDERKLIPVYKIFSPAHLLKQSFANDSNRLDRAFYNELLHIIGLEETKDKNKKLITRKVKERRDPGSFIENTILMLKTEDRLPKVTNIASYGKDKEDRLFNVALELNITWINRILFLKLLEAQLFRYHNGNESYKFLNRKSIKDFDVLNKLFFQVLAVKPEERLTGVMKEFGLVPYLNSSLFEINQLEDEAIRVNTLEDDVDIPIYPVTVLKEKNGKRRKGSLPALHYLFEFLDAYDFTSEGKEEIQEENKTLINASVLGLIFEKINGYKDGSFFTPGFITMYMCRETIRRAVVQKFNDKYDWNCSEFADLYNHLTGKTLKDILEYNSVINSLTLCDPAVGSGHFLVSALNEIISIKSELGILADAEGKLLRDYDVKIENDELIITFSEGTELFEYHLNESKPHSESQRVQKTLFHEKQTIIENCLFGVDINPNSVKIARLRLWIELLKNAYYTEESKFKELETLPNIDINIKEGNSLISRFPIDTDLKQVLKTIKWNVEDYKKLVYEYKNEHNKEVKQGVKKLIEDIKNNFRTEINARDPKRKTLNDYTYELHNKYQTDRLIDVEMDEKNKAQLKKAEEKLVKRIEKLSTEIKEIEEGEIYRNAFEWRFEFPEVLADNGDYLGFDVVMGNPPYITRTIKSTEKKHFNLKFEAAQYQLDLYILMMELGLNIGCRNAFLAFITPNSWLKNIMMSKIREFIDSRMHLFFIVPFLEDVFEDANVDTAILLAGIGNSSHDPINILEINNKEFKTKNMVDQKRFKDNNNYVFDVNVSESQRKVFNKILEKSVRLGDLFDITRGVNPYDKYTGQSESVIKNKVYHSDHKKDDTFVPELRGKHIEKYSYQWDGKHYLSYGPWLAAPRDIKYFSGPRIIFREILGETFIASYIEEDFIIDRSLYIAIPKEKKIPVKFILALLNSKFLAYFFRYQCNEFDNLFPKIRLKEFKDLPIILGDCPCQSKIEETIQNIINSHWNNSVNGKDTLSQIDIIVYKLYELAYDEVKIFDPDFTLTKEEYENYEVGDAE